MGIFFGRSSGGTAYISSKKDPRFNQEWREDHISIMSDSTRAETDRRVAVLAKELGCEPPDDLEYGAMKD